MIAEGEDELTCDLAEYYHIIDWRALVESGQLRPTVLATLSIGLCDNSRIKRKIANRNITLDQMLLSVIADRLGILIWQKTKDGHKNRNQPKSIFKALSGQDKQKEELMSFESPEEFEKWLKSKED